MTPSLSPVEELRDPALRARAEQHIEFLSRQQDPGAVLRAAYWQALLDGDIEQANNVREQISEVSSRTSLEQRLRDPEYRAGAQRYAAAMQKVNPTIAGFWHAMLDGETEQANNILRQQDLFKINRMLSENADEDGLEKKVLSDWKRSLIRKVRQ